MSSCFDRWNRCRLLPLSTRGAPEAFIESNGTTLPPPPTHTQRHKAYDRGCFGVHCTSCKSTAAGIAAKQTPRSPYRGHSKVEVVKVLLIELMKISAVLHCIHRKEVLLEELPRDAQVVRRALHHKVRLMVHKHAEAKNKFRKMQALHHYFRTTGTTQ